MEVGIRRGGAREIYASLLGLGLLLALAACGGGTSAENNRLSLSAIPWCDQPLINFQDHSTTPAKTLTSWDAVKDQLGFTPYLPPTLPRGSCLALAGGSIHDPIYGGLFSITYVLPGVGPLAFSEAPKRASAATSTQCVTAPVPGSKGDTTGECQGVAGGTSITIASRQPTSSLQTLFQSLQPNVDWVPTSSLGGSASPATSPTTSPGATPTASPSATAGG